MAGENACSDQLDMRINADPRPSYPDETMVELCFRVAYRAALTAAPQSPVPQAITANRCKCDFRTKMVGDGCRYCQPQEYIDRLHRQIEDDEREQAVPQVAKDAEIGRFLMSKARQNGANSWPHLWKIEWSGYATTNEGKGYRKWTLREAIEDHITALAQAMWGKVVHDGGQNLRPANSTAR